MISELIVQNAIEAVFIIVLAIMFGVVKRWTTRIESTADRMEKCLNVLRKEFTTHMLRIETRITRVETRVDDMQRGRGNGQN